MQTTVEQNRAHRTDINWVKSKGKHFTIGDETFLSQYVSTNSDLVIVRSWRMTGCDWHIYRGEQMLGREHSLTYAKYAAQGL